MLNRISIIQNLIDKNGYTNYLEIGVQAGDCFKAIRCETKVGVDPDKSSAATIHTTSDEFFELNEAKFDIVFIDGLHHADQVYKDILNSLDCLKKGGTIVMHDCLPTSKRMQEIPLQEQDEWTGDTWKAFVRLKCDRDDLEMRTVSTDWGCGIITKCAPKGKITGSLELPLEPFLTYENFCANRDYWMNVISEQQFIDIYL